MIAPDSFVGLSMKTNPQSALEVTVLERLHDLYRGKGIPVSGLNTGKAT